VYNAVELHHKIF